MEKSADAYPDWSRTRDETCGQPLYAKRQRLTIRKVYQSCTGNGWRLLLSSVKEELSKEFINCPLRLQMIGLCDPSWRTSLSPIFE